MSFLSDKHLLPSGFFGMFVTFRAKVFQVTNSPKILQVINHLSLWKLTMVAVYYVFTWKSNFLLYKSHHMTSQ